MERGRKGEKGGAGGGRERREVEWEEGGHRWRKGERGRKGRAEGVKYVFLEIRERAIGRGPLRWKSHTKIKTSAQDVITGDRVVSVV